MFHRLAVILTKGFLKLLSLKPLAIHRLWVRPLAFLIEKVFRYRVGVVRRNLCNSFPDKTDAGIESLKHEFYLHFATIVVEAVWFGGSSASRVRKSHIVEIANPDELAQMYEKAPGIMVMYSHAGNWELLGGIESYCYKEDTANCINTSNYCVVYLRQHSAVADEVIHANRFAPLTDKEHFEGYIESRQLVRYALKHRDQKKIYNVNTDQRPYFEASDSVAVTFMNQPCRTMSASAALAHKLGLGVMFQRMPVREDGKGYTIEYVKICDDGSQMSVEEMMRRYYELLEADIKAQPANYLWSHNRWA